jgi:hypothetical protein
VVISVVLNKIREIVEVIEVAKVRTEETSMDHPKELEEVIIVARQGVTEEVLREEEVNLKRLLSNTSLFNSNLSMTMVKRPTIRIIHRTKKITITSIPALRQRSKITDK